MGRLLEGLTNQVEAGEQQGEQIKETGEQKATEAETSAEQMNSIEGVDDDDQQAVESARGEASGIAAEVANSEINTPVQEVGQGFSETSAEATDAAEREHSDAQTASGMVGDYTSIGANLASTFEQSAANFEGISQQAEQSKADLEAAGAALSARLTGAFG